MYFDMILFKTTTLSKLIKGNEKATLLKLKETITGLNS